MVKHALVTNSTHSSLITDFRVLFFLKSFSKTKIFHFSSVDDKGLLYAGTTNPTKHEERPQKNSLETGLSGHQGMTLAQ